MNIIFANQTKTDKNKTLNGVGKSLLIQIIHFCFGCDKIEEFEKKLPGWIFYLDFELNGKIHCLSRSTEKQNIILYDGEEYNHKKFEEKLLNNIFNLSKKYPYVTLFSLLSRFIRRDETAYNFYDRIAEKETDYQKLINISYLLGLDINLVNDKLKYRGEYTNKKKNLETIKNDDIFKSCFFDSDNIESEIVELEEKIESLENSIHNFSVSKDYQQIENEANELSHKLSTLNNRKILLQSRERKINDTLSQSITLTTKDVQKMYSSLGIELPTIITREIKEVEDFHNKILESRKIRFNKELEQIQCLLKQLEQEIDISSQQFDEYMKLLSTNGALDVYSSLTSNLSNLKVKKDKLTSFSTVIQKYNTDLLNLQTKISEENVKAEDYLISIKKKKTEIIGLFKKLSNKFYPKKSSSFTINNNVGENTLRFDIDVSIQDDSSTGINKVKIFCFDVLLFLQKISEIRFILHDSLLFSNIDNRQIAKAFEIAYECVINNDLQYIVSLNEDQYDSFKDQLSENCKKIIDENIILQLNDKDATGKLLGIDVKLKV
jgi:uncharacterized protein YydD (DUF2326 family)